VVVAYCCLTYYCMTCSAVGALLSPLSRRFQAKQTDTRGCIACLYASQLKRMSQ
jgi:hypothetical protein